jgi:exodeoxyribonuclease VII small subunit
MGMASTLPADDDATFEQLLERLRVIVEMLEDGELPLEKSLELFEEGIRLSRLGAGRLDAAERRIEELLASDDAKGEPRRVPVEPPGSGP